MAGPLHELFFGSAEVEFESDYPLAESVQRLQEVSRALSPAIRGTVAETYVSIYRADPPARQDFRPWFFGSFVVRNERVLLRGAYSMHVGVRILLGLWLAGCAYALWRSLFAAIDATASPALPLVPLGLFATGALVAWAGRKRTHDDPTWISEVITRTLRLPH